jgi:hypothetical protein
MKYNLNLVREILFAIENHTSGFAPQELSIDGYTQEQIRYNIFIMIKDCLVDGFEVTALSSTSPQAIATNLTPKGHNFLELPRNNTHWNKAVDISREKGSAITIGVLTQLLSVLAKKAVGL